MTNRLGGETSPYLLQHAANPVAWQPWDAAALAAAREQDKPILLSIGYSACHWCHVMAHESFEDAEVAAVMNRHFVNIKVDREERPDLDRIYQSAHQMLTGRAGGWPLTLFLAPDGTPFFGGTYFPKAPRYGLGGFPDICDKVATAYRQRRGDIETQNESLREALATPVVPSGATSEISEEFTTAPLAAASQMLLGSLDRRFGGFGGAPKFPHPTDLALLLCRDDTGSRDAALLTLRHMAEGGIYDQIGGGFCRYSVDERWEIPHFEKMLYDNGQLLGLYADAWALTGDALFARVVEETVAWLEREMTSPEGGFYSSLDADSEGEEGRFYVWTREQVQALLSPEEWRIAAPAFGLDGVANFEGAWHLTRRGAAQSVPVADQALLNTVRAKLFAVRERRVRPGRDDKLLTSWNALAIEGLARAARRFNRSDWLRLAQDAADFLRRNLYRDDRLLATWKDGRAHLNAYLDDHAYLLSALLELMSGEFRVDDLTFARRLADDLLIHFEDTEAGGFFFTRHDHEALIARPKSPFDNATPAGNGVAVRTLLELGHLIGEPRYLEIAHRTLRVFWPLLRRQTSGLAALLHGLELAVALPTLCILRGPVEAVADWQRRLAAMPVRVVALPNGLVDLPPALAKPESGHVNAWICQGVTCHAPIADFEELASIFKRV
ncbi:MAG: thioredoxin domain-containing protein [Rhodocyclaceae bacterium]|nr:thioredoxin domain-containing protein [Rhodocyclaceae bacterium]